MPEEILIELAEQPQKKPFYKTRNGIAVIIALVFVIMAALFSWWLALGKIESAVARLDTMIYTVGSDFPARVKTLFVMAGDQVEDKQPLGVIESPEFAGQLETAAQELANLRAMAGLPQSRNPGDSASQIEKEAAIKLAQARFEEERLQKLYQEKVTEHVRAQLNLRSRRVSQDAAYIEALNNERALAAAKQEALENFEKASKFRATLDQALAKIKNAILSVKRSAGLNTALQKAISGPATFGGETTLFSTAKGSVFRVVFQPGQVVQPGESIFYILPQTDSPAGGRWIQAWFAPEDKDDIKPGQPVSIKFPEVNLVLAGKVESVAENEQVLPEDLNTEPGASSYLSRDSREYAKKLFIPVKISLNDGAKVDALEPGTRAECQIQTHYIIGNGWL